MILLLGGTSESLAVADLLTRQNLPFVLSVTTAYGVDLAKTHAAHVTQQVLQPEDFAPFFAQQHITQVIDATHPFARVISTLAIAATAATGIPYVRFERPDLLTDNATQRLVPDFTAACAEVRKLTGTIYLSTGSKTASDFAAALGLARLHVRVLPTTTVMTKLTTAGFDATQIDAMRGPFSTALNVELFRRVHAVAVVSKESGKRGGVQEKLAACQELGIPCIIIRRPQMAYPAQVQSIAALATYLEVAV